MIPQSTSENKNDPIGVEEEVATTDVDANKRKSNAAPVLGLSKAWGEKMCHTTIYNGGKIAMCRGQGTKNLYGYNESETEETKTPFLVALCGGDLAIIDATRGIKARTIRAGVTTSAQEEVALETTNDAMDDDMLDVDAIVCFCLSYNDCDLITASRNTTLRHYDLTGRPNVSYKHDNGKGPAIVQRIYGTKTHDSPIKCMEFHKSGAFFASGSVDGTAKVWDHRGGYATHSFPPITTGAITALAWAPGVTTLVLAVATEQGSITLYDLKTNSPVANLRDGHLSAVTCLRWTSRGDFFVTAGRDAVINVWSVEEDIAPSFPPTKKNKKENKTKTLGTVQTIYKRIVTKPIYEQIEGMEIMELNSHSSSSVSSSIVVATAGSKGQVRLWKATRGETTLLNDFECILAQSEHDMFGEQRGGYTYLLRDSSTASANGLIAVDAEHNLTFLSADNNLDVKKIFIGHNDEILDLRLIPLHLDNKDSSSEEEDHQRIAVATNSAQVRLFDLGTFSCQVLDGHTETVLALDVSPCGRYLVTCGKDKTMRLWHIGTAKCIGVASGHTEAVGATALSRKIGKYEVSGKASVSGAGAFAVTASKDRTLKKWALIGAAELNKCAAENKVLKLVAIVSARAHEKDINIVTVAPNDSLIATGSQDKTVKLWRSSDLSLQGTLYGHKRGVWDCQFSPFDRVIATASVDQTVKLWSLTSCDCLRTFQGHTSSVLRVRFLTAGLQLLSAGADGLVKLWTIRTNECEATMDGHTDKVWALDLSGDVLVSAGADSRTVVWKDTTSLEEQAKKESEEKMLLMEQRLSNHVRFKEYEQALEIAFELDKPNQALKVLSSIIENDIENGKEVLDTLKRHVSLWPMNRTTQVLKYCRDWNTRARNSQIAMLIVRAVVGVIPAATLATTDGIPELFAQITPYAERHFERLDKIHGNSYLIDFTLVSMGTLLPEEDNWMSKQNFVLPPKHIVAQIHKAKGISHAENEDPHSGEDSTTDESSSDSEDELSTAISS